MAVYADGMATIEISLPDGTAEAYVSRPEGEGPWPGVLFFIDAIGLRPQIEQMADRIASWGYVVLAPNIFFRNGTATELAPTGDLTQPGEREKFFATVGPRLEDLNPARMEADIPVYVDALLALDGVANGAIGVTGYCAGARLSTRASGLRPEQVAAVGGFHGGRLVTDDPDSPHLRLATARAEFVYGHADNDGSMTPENVASLGQALASHGLRASNEIYPGSPHGYTMADTSSYDQTGAERHFDELKALFARAL